MSKDNMFVGPYADSVNAEREWIEGRKEREADQEVARLKMHGTINRAVDKFFQSGDQIEMSLDEQIERAEFEANRAADHLRELYIRRNESMITASRVGENDLAFVRERVEDSGLAEVDNTPGRELDDYSKKHGE